MAPVSPSAEVDVVVAVDVGDAGAPRARVEVEREAAGALVHPRHRHPAEQVLGGRERLGGQGISLDVVRALALQQLGEPAAVDHGEPPFRPGRGLACQACA